MQTHVHPGTQPRYADPTNPLPLARRGFSHSKLATTGLRTPIQQPRAGLSGTQAHSSPRTSGTDLVLHACSRPVHHRALSSVPSLYPQRALIPSPQCDNQNVPSHCQVLLMTKSHLPENHCAKEIQSEVILFVCLIK
jgi:hypothetical protein